MRLITSLTAALVFAFSFSVHAVDINSATAAQLADGLQGIGMKKAEAIVNYRQKNGAFKSIDDLKNVNGIGDKLVSRNRKNLSVSDKLKAAAKGAVADKVVPKNAASLTGKNPVANIKDTVSSAKKASAAKDVLSGKVTDNVKDVAKEEAKKAVEKKAKAEVTKAAEKKVEEQALNVLKK